MGSSSLHAEGDRLPPLSPFPPAFFHSREISAVLFDAVAVLLLLAFAWGFYGRGDYLHYIESDWLHGCGRFYYRGLLPELLGTQGDHFCPLWTLFLWAVSHLSGAGEPRCMYNYVTSTHWAVLSLHAANMVLCYFLIKYLTRHPLASFLGVLPCVASVAAAWPIAYVTSVSTPLATVGMLLYVFAALFYTDQVLSSRKALILIALLFLWPILTMEHGLLALPVFFLLRPSFSLRAMAWNKRSLHVVLTTLLIVVAYFLANRLLYGRWIIKRSMEAPIYVGYLRMIGTLFYPQWSFVVVSREFSSIISYWAPVLVFLFLIVRCGGEGRRYILAALAAIALNVVGVAARPAPYYVYLSLPMVALIWASLLKEVSPPPSCSASSDLRPASRTECAVVLPLALVFAFALGLQIRGASEVLSTYGKSGRVHRSFLQQMESLVSRDDIDKFAVETRPGTKAVTTAFVVCGEETVRLWAFDYYSLMFAKMYGAQYGYPLCNASWDSRWLRGGYGMLSPTTPAVLRSSIALFWNGAHLGRRLDWPDLATGALEASEIVRSRLVFRRKVVGNEPAVMAIGSAKPTSGTSLAGLLQKDAPPANVTISYAWKPVAGKVQFLAMWKDTKETGAFSLIDMPSTSLSFLDASGKVLQVIKGETRSRAQAGDWNKIWFPQWDKYLDPPPNASRVAFTLTVNLAAAQGGGEDNTLLIDGPVCIFRK